MAKVKKIPFKDVHQPSTQYTGNPKQKRVKKNKLKKGKGQVVKSICKRQTAKLMRRLTMIIRETNLLQRHS